MDKLAFTNILGLVVMLGFIGTPVYILFFTTLLTGPRGGRAKLVFVGTIATLITGFILITLVYAGLTSLFIP